MSFSRSDILMGGKCLRTLNPKLAHKWPMDCCEPQTHLVQLLQMCRSWFEMLLEQKSLQLGQWQFEGICQSCPSWVSWRHGRFLITSLSLSAWFGSVLLRLQASPIWFWSTLAQTLGFWLFLQDDWHTATLLHPLDKGQVWCPVSTW